MDWVMVPVPEELADDVERLLFQLKFKDSMVQWTADLMRAHLLSLSDEARRAVFAVSAAALAGEPLEDIELAARLGVPQREIYAVLRDANDVTVAALGGDLIGVRQVDSVDDGAGGTRVRRVLIMMPLVAAMVRGESDLLAPEP
jgi:hypothetical protein